MYGNRKVDGYVDNWLIITLSININWKNVTLVLVILVWNKNLCYSKERKDWLFSVHTSNRHPFWRSERGLTLIINPYKITDYPSTFCMKSYLETKHRMYTMGITLKCELIS